MPRKDQDNGKFVDLTPTWATGAQILSHFFKSDAPNACHEELARMGAVADVGNNLIGALEKNAKAGEPWAENLLREFEDQISAAQAK